MSDAGKGDDQRPREDKYCTKKQFERNWERTFGKKEEQEENNELR